MQQAFVTFSAACKAVPLHEAQRAKHRSALAIGKQEGTNLSGWKPRTLSPEIGTSETRALPVKKLGYDYGIMTIV